MKSYFAPPERATKVELAWEIQQLANNPVIDALMNTANGLFAVLNGQRQILALNESFLKLMGIENSEQSLGLRPGEFVRCIHACEMPAGCGTSQYCSTCGAAIAILAAIDSDHPQERYCALTVERDHKEVDIFLQVRSNRLMMQGQQLILLFLQDVSIQQQRANLEQTFFHDINNILCGVLGRSQLLSESDAAHRQLHHGILRLTQEIAIQKALLASLADNYRPLYSECTANRILNELAETMHSHPLVGNRQLLISAGPHDIPLVTDEHLAHRVLTNMVCNALEATEPGGVVKVGLEPGGNSVSFSVWNAGAIPADIARRIFQRNFSTKQSMGRGLGTYSMKFFGEQVLGGQVGFETNHQNGTTFTFTLMCQ